VVQQIWLELLSRTVNAYGATAVVAVPAQLCVRHEPGIATALLSDDEREVTLKTSSNDGIGLPVDIALAGDDSASLRQVFALISAMTPDISTRMYVPPSRLGTYQAELDRLPEFSVRIALLEDGWKHWIKSIGTVEMNLLAGAANAARAHRRDWRSRRLLVALALLVPLVNIAGLNAEWLDLQQQADRLRNGMMQAYRTAYPQDKVVVDPLLQMQRHVTDAGRNAGNAAPDDFLALLARFGDAWRGVRPDTVAATFVTRLDYRERSLTVSLQPGNAGTMEKLQAALAAQGAAVVQTGTDSWQIRSRP
jgi:general secretion pathway protein L